jgi:hypothetical protein
MLLRSSYAKSARVNRAAPTDGLMKKRPRLSLSWVVAHGALRIFQNIFGSALGTERLEKPADPQV